MLLANQTAIITGASSGVGRATALAFVKEGSAVLLTARREDRLIAICSQIRTAGGRAEYVVGDAALESTASAAASAALQHFGKIDHLINNTGMGNYKNLVDTSTAEYDQMMDTNMKSSFLFTRAVVPQMIAQRSGNIVFVSSIVGLRGAAGEAVYSATKFAQAGFSQSLDEELRQYNIKVGCFFPGGIKTEFAVGLGRTELSVAASNMMDPADVADAILFISTRPANARVNELTLRHMG